MKELWNKYTDKFGLTIFHPQYFMNKYNREAINLAKKYSKNKDIIDFGCGRMTYKNYLLETSNSYFGIDHPTESRRYLSADKPDLLTKFDKTNLSSNHFDSATMFEVLEYLDHPGSPEEVLSEIHRVLKKKGKIVITSPFMYPVHDSDIDKNRFTDVKIKALLRNSGFKKIKVTKQGNFFVFLTTSILVYIFKNINNMNEVLKLFLLPIALVATFLINLATLPFKNIRNDDFPVNILAVAEK